MEFVIQGKKGNGKGIIAVAMMHDYLLQGRPVATNVNLFLENLLPLTSRTTVLRLPDQPTYQDMLAIGTIDTGGDEKKNGLIVLDECASWLNARDYSDPDRKKLLDWFVHSRKHGWDVAYVIQNINMLDKQFRDGFAEHVINVVRLDRLGIPFLSPLLKLFGLKVKLPQLHLGTIRYGTQRNAPVADRIIKSGRPYWAAYDTLQKFTRLNEFQGVSSTLSAWHMRGRNLTWWQMHKSSIFAAFVAGTFCVFFLTVSVGKLMGFQRPEPEQDIVHVQEDSFSETTITGFYFVDNRIIATLSDGRTVESLHYTQTRQGYKVEVGGTWYAQPGVRS